MLRIYAQEKAEEAFAELTRRHVDHVYSVASRMVCDPHLAEDVTQSAFVALAQKARPLQKQVALSAWLHSVTHHLAANMVRSEVRRRARETEAFAMNDPASSETDVFWAKAGPLLDDLLVALSDEDRDAIALRYFEKKSAREMGAALGISDAAAQKRVTRALERLRRLFDRQGVSVGAGAIATALSAHAVQGAPIGLALTISTNAILPHAAVSTVAFTKAIAMTTLQKSCISGVIALSIGFGLYEGRRAAKLSDELQSVPQIQPSAANQLRNLEDERNRLAAIAEALHREVAALQQQVAEVPRLRGEVAQLRAGGPAAPQNNPALDPSDPSVQAFLASRAQAQKIVECLEQRPDKKIPELVFLEDEDWRAVSKNAKFDSETNIRQTLSHLRARAKKRLPIADALVAYVNEHGDQIPSEMSELKPYLQNALGSNLFGAKRLPEDVLEAILDRYGIYRSGKFSDLEPGAHIIFEKAPVDKEYDSRAKFGRARTTIMATGPDVTNDPADPPY